MSLLKLFKFLPIIALCLCCLSCSRGDVDSEAAVYCKLHDPAYKAYYSVTVTPIPDQEGTAAVDNELHIVISKDGKYLLSDQVLDLSVDAIALTSACKYGQYSGLSSVRSLICLGINRLIFMLKSV